MNQSLQDPLFRPEATRQRARRLDGDIILTQPMSMHLVAAVIVLVLAIAGLWLALGSYPRIERVQGTLVTSRPSAKIQVPVAGRIAELRVKEGDVVRAGAVLAVLDLDRPSSEGHGNAGDAIAAIDNRLGLSGDQIRLVQSQLDSDQGRLRETIAASDRQAAGLTRQIGLQRQIVASNRGMLDRIGTVVSRGFVSQVEYERRRQTLLNSEQALEQLEQQLLAIGSRKSEAQSQLAALSVQADRDASIIRSNMEEMRQERSRARGEQSYVVTAPISGRVSAVQAAPGRTVIPAVPMMTIVPEGSGLVAELYAPSRAIGLVRPGQETRLLLDSFPYRRFGGLDGHVATISRTVIDPRDNLAPVQMKESFFVIVVNLDRQTIDNAGEHLPLQPGMTLEANIVLERQSFFEWLLSPLNAVLKRTS